MRKGKEITKRTPAYAESMAGRYDKLIERIAEILNEARTKVIREINKAQVLAYWEIGREIVEFEQKGKARAEYGEELIVRLAKDMTEKFGKGFSKSNLFLMRQFYLTYPEKFQTVSGKSLESKKFQTVSGKSETLSTESQKQQTVSAKSQISRTPSNQFVPMLSWSHYCELLKVEEPLARSFYEQEAIQNNWSVRELKRQVNSMLFERLALSKDTKAVMKMAEKGQVVEKPEDAVKDPYILEFLNLREETSYTETQLEQAIIDKLQYFLLEMGKGFSFVARQKRITINNRHYYIDLVFYNRFLRCFVLIDLKTGELDHSDIGQMNFYLNYFKENEKTEDENNPNDNRKIIAWGRITGKDRRGFNLLLVEKEGDIYGDWYIMINKNSPSNPNPILPEPFAFEFNELERKINLIGAIHIYYKTVRVFDIILLTGLIERYVGT